MSITEAKTIPLVYKFQKIFLGPSISNKVMIQKLGMYLGQLCSL